MLPGEQGLPEDILSYHSNIVDQVVQFVCKESDAYLADRVRRLIRTLQLRWHRRARRQIFCPACGVDEHIFTRDTLNPAGDQGGAKRVYFASGFRES
jgi:hypothetical protein